MPAGERHADFEPGNEVALRHGAHSERAITAKAHDLEPGFVDWLGRVAPWAAGDEFLLARTNYLRSAAVVELLTDDVVATATEQGTKAVPTRRFETLLTALNTERKALEGLGLTPPTRAALAQTTAQAGVAAASLADLAASGREARLAAEARFATTAAERPPEALEPAGEPPTTPEPSDDRQEDQP